MVTTKIKHKIESIMTGDHRDGEFCLKLFLSILSAVYGGAVALRRRAYQKNVLKPKRLPCIVVSIGNLTMGGTGKTPMTLYVTQRIKALGYRVSIISRGYKGRTEKRGGIVSDGRNILMSSKDAGDEPFMMASKLRDIPVIIGQNRFDAGMLAVKHFAPDVLVLDDAFQHVKLRRDIDLVLLDSRRPFGNGYLFPKGILRESIPTISNGDAVILTKSNFLKEDVLVKLKNMLRPTPVFQSTHVPYIDKVIRGTSTFHPPGPRNLFAHGFETFNGKRVLAFSGIANNDDFRQTIEGFKCKLIGFFGFPDHYRYSTRELDKILNSAMARSADFILTTEKDYARITREVKWSIDLAIIGVEICFGGDDVAFQSFINTKLAELIKQRRANIE